MSLSNDARLVPFKSSQRSMAMERRVRGPQISRLGRTTVLVGRILRTGLRVRRCSGPNRGSFSSTLLAAGCRRAVVLNPRDVTPWHPWWLAARRVECRYLRRPSLLAFPPPLPRHADTMMPGRVPRNVVVGAVVGHRRRFYGPSVTARVTPTPDDARLHATPSPPLNPRARIFYRRDVWL